MLHCVVGFVLSLSDFYEGGGGSRCVTTASIDSWFLIGATIIG